MLLSRERLVALRDHHQRVLERYAGSDMGTTQQELVDAISMAIVSLDNLATTELGDYIASVTMDFAVPADISMTEHAVIRDAEGNEREVIVIDDFQQCLLSDIAEAVTNYRNYKNNGTVL